MDYEPLYKRIEQRLRPGDPSVTAQAVATMFGCSESHARDTLEWMARQPAPKLSAVPGSKPKQWQP